MGNRFLVDTCGTLIDLVTGNHYDYVSEVVGLLEDYDGTVRCLSDEVEHLKYNVDELFGLDKVDYLVSLLMEKQRTTSCPLLIDAYTDLLEDLKNIDPIKLMDTYVTYHNKIRELEIKKLELETEIEKMKKEIQ